MKHLTWILYIFIAAPSLPGLCAQGTAGRGSDWEAIRRAADITLRSEVQHRGLELRVGDIAEVTGVDGDTLRRIRLTSLGDAPLPGSGKVLSLDTVREVLKRQLPGLDLRFHGAAAVRVVPQSLRIPSEEVLTLVRRELWRELGAGTHETDVRPSSPPADLMVPVGRFSNDLQVERTDPGAPLAGLIRFKVQTLVDGSAGPATFVELTYRRTVPVLVVTRRIRAGQPIGPGDVRREERMSDSRSGAIFERAEQLAGFVARRVLEPGECVTDADLKGVPVVRRNDSVAVQVRQGALLVTGTGIAMEAGAPGETIPVRTGERRRVVHAKVIDSKTVELSLGAGETLR